ncbi:MAG: hypothetical protein JNL05_14110 [Flavobacteriales bacterium]|nr:hypothetical protein [Flavobacteriales bacterium]
MDRLFRTIARLLLLSSLPWVPGTLQAQQAALAWGPVLDCNAQGEGSLRPRVVVNATGEPVVLWGANAPASNWVAVGNGGGFAPAQEVSTPGCIPAVADWMGSSIAAVGNTLWVVMKATPEESRPVYVRRSDDGGLSWGDTLRVEPADGLVSRFPSIEVVDPDAPIVQYMQFDSGYFGARQVVSHMMGGAFMPPVQVSAPYAPGDVCDCCPNQVVAVADHTVALYRNAGPNIRVMWGATSFDGGMTFPLGAVLDTTGWVLGACPSSGPDGYLVGDSIRYVWMSGANNGTKVYIGQALAADLSLGAQRFVHLGQLQNQQQNLPRIAGQGDTLAVVWQQTQGGQTEILFSWSVSGIDGLSVPDTVNVDLSGVQRTPDIAYANGAFHIVWGEVTGSRVRYRKAALTGDVAVVEQEQSRAVNAWPNPATDRLHFSPGFTYAAVVDGQGRRVLNASATAGVVDLATLVAGPYVLLLTTMDGTTLRARFVKQ